MTTIELKNVSKSFSEKGIILRSVSFKVESRAFMAILGPANAGKTTLLRIIAGVERPDSGRIYFDGEDVTELPPQKRIVGMSFQSFALYPNLNVYDNIASPLKMMGVKPQEIRERVSEQASTLQIQHLLTNFPKELSGGESQRVALARAIVKKAKICLLDEPLSNLDFKLREGMRVELKRLLEKERLTIIYATPDPEEAMVLADSLVVLNNGEVLQSGSTEECYSRPANVFVGKYFSKPQMNLIKADLVQDGEKTFLACNDLRIDVTHMNLPSDETEYILGLRAHDLSLTETKEDMITVSAILELEEISGSEMIIRLNWYGSRLTMYAPYVVHFEEKPIKLFIDPLDLFIFSNKTGKLLSKFFKKSTGENFG